MRQNEGQENGYGRYCNHNMRRALPRTPRDVAVLFSARYLTVLTGGSRLSHVLWGNVVGLAEPVASHRSGLGRLALLIGRRRSLGEPVRDIANGARGTGAARQASQAALGSGRSCIYSGRAFNTYSQLQN